MRHACRLVLDFHRCVTLHHELIGVVSDGEQVRGHLSLPLAPVLGDDRSSVDGETSVGVDGYTEQAGVSLE